MIVDYNVQGREPGKAWLCIFRRMKKGDAKKEAASRSEMYKGLEYRVVQSKDCSCNRCRTCEGM